MISALLTAALLAPVPQGGDDLEGVLASQARRTKMVADCSAATCSVMGMKSPGGGSGVIFHPLGFVLSNFHVVQARGKKKGGEFDPAQKDMKIGLPDGNLYKAKVLGIDPGSDLAVLLLDERKDGKPWPWRPLGDSDKLIVGETVFATGNPFLLATDFTPTVTWGIVSGVHRYQSGKQNRFLVYPDCVQIDAPVNPGNSGGPSFNEQGEIIGINGRITVRDRGRVNTGVGFAISSNQIKNFLADMMAGKHTEHGTLDMNAWFMKQPGQTERRVIVQSIFADAHAAKLGLNTGDWVTSFNGVPINSANQMATLIGVIPSGSWATVGFKAALESEAWAPEIHIDVKLRALDTGSSKYARGTTMKIKKLAARALTENVGKDQKTIGGVTLNLDGPEGKKTRMLRRGSKLRLELSDRTLVRTGEKEGFKIVDGKTSKLDGKEQARLESEYQSNPWLWRGEDLRKRLMGSWLVGGVLVQGRPAYRIRIPGEWEMEMFFFEDGSPAGYRYRDFETGRVVGHLVRDGRWWTEVRKEFTKGWTMKEPVTEPLPPANLFKVATQ